MRQYIGTFLVMLCLIVIVAGGPMAWGGNSEIVPNSTRLEGGIERQMENRLREDLNLEKMPSWKGWNTLGYGVRLAIENGVSPVTIVLLLLLPVVATMVSLLHYVVGISGFGSFMPSMIAVAFLATGVYGGLLLFALILMISIVGGVILRKLKLHYWPARSINLLFIGLGTFGLMWLTASVEILDIRQVSIFPVLTMIVLAEDFVRTQLTKSKKAARSLTLGTLLLALAGAGLMQWQALQRWVLLYPEIVLLLVIVINMWVGNYGGMRLTELSRFKKAFRK